jgi:hypothetical protein
MDTIGGVAAQLIVGATLLWAAMRHRKES